MQATWHIWGENFHQLMRQLCIHGSFGMFVTCILKSLHKFMRIETSKHSISSFYSNSSALSIRHKKKLIAYLSCCLNWLHRLNARVQDLERFLTQPDVVLLLLRYYCNLKCVEILGNAYKTNKIHGNWSILPLKAASAFFRWHAASSRIVLLIWYSGDESKHYTSNLKYLKCHDLPAWTKQ